MTTWKTVGKFLINALVCVVMAICWYSYIPLLWQEDAFAAIIMFLSSVLGTVHLVMADD